MLNGLYSVYVQANTLFVVVFYILLLAFQQIPSEVEWVEVTRVIFFRFGPDGWLLDYPAEARSISTGFHSIRLQRIAGKRIILFRSLMYSGHPYFCSLK